MTLSCFEQKLKKLNRNISIYQAGDMTRPAGIWVMVPTYEGGEYEELCGIEKHSLREFPTYSKTGKMLTGGWHRVLYLLCAKGYINRHESVKYFGTWYVHREPFQIFEKSAVDQAVDYLYNHPVDSKRIEDPLNPGQYIEVPVYSKDDTVDIGRMIANSR